MEQHLNNLVSYVHQSVSLCTVNPPTLTSAQLRYLFSIVDIKRKKYLDLNEVYELVGDVSQKEMFWIFKWMDGEKRGIVTVQDLERILCGQQNNRQSKLDKNHVFTIFYQRVDAMKDKFKALERLKQKFNFNSNTLASIYNYFIISSKPNPLTLDFISTFLAQRAKRFNLDWNTACQTELKKMTMESQALSLEKFTEMFGVQAQPQFQQKSFNEHRQRIDQFAQNIRDKYGLNRAWESDSKPKSNFTSVTKQKITESPTEYHVHRWESQKYPMDRKLSKNNDKNQSSNRLDVQSLEKKFHKNPQTSIQTKQFAFGQENIDQALKNIEKRRQQLRRDSIERKKLIEEVMHRKKQANGLSVDPEDGWEERINSLNNYAKYSSISSTLKKSSGNKSYLTPSHAKPLIPSSVENTPLREGYIADKMERFNKWQQQIRNQKRFDSRWENTYEEVDYTRLQSAKLEKIRNERIGSQDQFRSKGNNYDLQEILNKYQQASVPQASKSFLKEYDESKLLMRSTSGLLNPSNKPLTYAAPAIEFLPTPPVDSLFARPASPLSSSVTKYPRSNILGSKENLMRRAEDEAARKIEQIERKARMKVMEKKAMMNRWGK